MRRRYFPGETVRVALFFDDDVGQPVAVTGVSVVWQRAGEPPVTVPSQDVVEVSAGRWQADIVVTAPGQHVVRGAATGPTSSATEERFEVVQSGIMP